MNICLDCGEKVDRKHKTSFGIWKGDCEMCGEKDVLCADAAHDFGYYKTEKERLIDIVQDQI